MTRDFYSEIEEANFKPITYRLYNKIDDDNIPYTLGKKNNTVYGIDDFVYYTFDLSKKEKFLLTMHNKEFLKNIKELNEKILNENYILDIDFNNGEINIIKYL